MSVVRRGLRKRAASRDGCRRSSATAVWSAWARCCFSTEAAATRDPIGRRRAPPSICGSRWRCGQTPPCPRRTTLWRHSGEPKRWCRRRRPSTPRRAARSRRSTAAQTAATGGDSTALRQPPATVRRPKIGAQDASWALTFHRSSGSGRGAVVIPTTGESFSRADQREASDPWRWVRRAAESAALFGAIFLRLPMGGVPGLLQRREGHARRRWPLPDRDVAASAFGVLGIGLAVVAAVGLWLPRSSSCFRGRLDVSVGDEAGRRRSSGRGQAHT